MQWDIFMNKEIEKLNDLMKLQIKIRNSSNPDRDRYIGMIEDKIIKQKKLLRELENGQERS